MHNWIIYIEYPIMPNCNLCHSDFPNHLVIDGKLRNVSNRKFCLICSPFGKHNTKKLNQLSPMDIGKKRCPRCLNEKSGDEFYKRRNGKDYSVYCKQCTSDETIERQQRFKRQCVEYKGGKCEKCGYNKCIAALDFHHKNPKDKDFSIAHVKLTTFTDLIKQELDKCQLVCANCHREIHARMVKLDITCRYGR